MWPDPNFNKSVIALSEARCNPGTEFKCKTAEVCLPMGFVCDGDPHCPNGEDEEFCQKFRERSILFWFIHAFYYYIDVYIFLFALC